MRAEKEIWGYTFGVAHTTATTDSYNNKLMLAIFLFLNKKNISYSFFKRNKKSNILKADSEFKFKSLQPSSKVIFMFVLQKWVNIDIFVAKKS